MPLHTIMTAANTVSRARPAFSSAREHDRDDQRHLDDGHGDREDERAERLADAVRDHLGVVDGREDRGDQRRAGGGGEDARRARASRRPGPPMRGWATPMPTTACVPRSSSFSPTISLRRTIAGLSARAINSLYRLANSAPRLLETALLSCGRPPQGGGTNVLAKLSTIVEDPRTERVIMTLIIVNAITLGLQTSKTVMAAIGPFLELFDDVIVWVFVIELTARIVVYRWAFFRDPWSVFDFIVVAIALVPASQTFSVLRALRILRALRLITAVPALKAVVAGLLAALPGMGSIVLLIGLLYYVFAVIAVKLYGTEFPELFGTLGKSFFTLFTVMTLEGWVEVVKSMLPKFPYAWVFFVTFIVTTTFMVLNLFIGVVVNAMQKEHEKEQQELDAERDIVQEEAAPILREVRSLGRGRGAAQGDGEDVASGSHDSVKCRELGGPPLPEGRG